MEQLLSNPVSSFFIGLTTLTSNDGSGYYWSTCIDTMKGLTFLAVLFIIIVFQTNNLTLWIYFAVHGSYGIFWCLKGILFPDFGFYLLRPWKMLPLDCIGLGLYWVGPYMIAKHDIQQPQYWYLCLCIFTYLFGVFFHFTSDMQKFMWLNLKKGNLLMMGMWKICRNPNYFGELLIYSSFIMISRHWFPAVWLSIVITHVWFPRMIKKEKSLSRYPEFAHYKKSSAWFIPYVW
jgi:protein-S-isoprenylcysteine O-methyltransferase Ste14